MNWNFLALRLTNFLYLLKKKFFLYFVKWNSLALRLKNVLYFRTPTFKFSLKKFLIFFLEENCSEIISLCFRKWNFLAPSLKNSYISGGNLQTLENKKLLYFFKGILPNFEMIAEQAAKEKQSLVLQDEC